MNNIVQPRAFAETITEFVFREGPVTTLSISQRFGLDMAETRKRLHALKRTGILDSRRETFGGDYGGKRLAWFAANRDGA